MPERKSATSDGAEADGRTEDAGPGDERSQVETELRKHQQPRDQIRADGDDVAEERPQGLGPLSPSLGVDDELGRCAPGGLGIGQLASAPVNARACREHGSTDTR